jgi:hypothetical protein
MQQAHTVQLKKNNHIAALKEAKLTSISRIQARISTISRALKIIKT